MTGRSMARRVGELEAATPALSWQAWQGRPFAEWPEGVWEGWVRATVPGFEGEGPLTAPELHRLLAWIDAEIERHGGTA
jgi:hypothetical protein